MLELGRHAAVGNNIPWNGKFYLNRLIVLLGCLTAGWVGSTIRLYLVSQVDRSSSHRLRLLDFEFRDDGVLSAWLAV